MSDFENKASESAGVPASGDVDWKAECNDLRRQSFLLLVGCVVISFIVTGFLGVQYVRTNNDLAIIQPQAAQVTEALKKQQVSVDTVKARLVEFGQSHSDFIPILTKNDIKPVAGSPPQPPTLMPPVPPAPKK